MNGSFVSVLMPVYNGEKYLKEAIDSILSQTYSNFEFLIIDDGSTDKSKEIIKSYKDKRIRLIENETNLGLPKTLNKGLKLAKGKYIVRMDCDDISLPERIEIQVKYMDGNLDVGISGTRYIELENGKVINLPTEFESIKIRLLFHCPINHPSVIIRKSIIIENTLFYDENKIGELEDYDLWLRSSKFTEITNLAVPLVKYRTHENQLTKVYKEGIQSGIDDEILQQLSVLGINPTEHEWRLHKKLQNLLPSEYTKGSRLLPSDYISHKREVENWFEKIINYNNQKDIYNPSTLKQVLGYYIQELGGAVQEMQKVLSNIDNGESIYIWGTGEYASGMFKYLMEKEYKVTGFIDNSENRWGESFKGLNIFSPSVLLERKKQGEDVFIIIASMYYKEISTDLIKLGLKKNKDFIDRILLY